MPNRAVGAHFPAAFLDSCILEFSPPGRLNLSICNIGSGRHVTRRWSQFVEQSRAELSPRFR